MVNQSRRWSLHGVVVLLSAVFLVACPKRPPEPPPVDEPAPVELSVRAVKPSQGESDKATPFQINGAGFKSGAKVFFGDTAAVDVQVVNGENLRGVVPSGLKEGAYDVIVRNSDGKEVKLTEGFVVMPTRPQDDGASGRDCQLKNVFFEFDMASLSDASRDTLQANAECLKARKARKVEVAGHTDERGSTDYNLALGQRRADEVKRYLGTLGISGIGTISFGEERPADSGGDEAAWSKNRRAETRVVE